jgi:hypothetical protein
LNEYLPPILRFGAIFMYDNMPIYTAYIIQDWLQENVIYRSYPELIGISNSQASLDLLIRYTIVIWEDLGDQLLTRLLDSMEHRVEVVIEAKGWYTKY